MAMTKTGRVNVGKTLCGCGRPVTTTIDGKPSCGDAGCTARTPRGQFKVASEKLHRKGG